MLIRMDYILFALVIIIAGVFQGLIGFGQGLVATPIALSFMSRNTAYTALLIVGIAVNMTLILRIRERASRSILGPLLLCSIVGMPFGLVLLKLLAPNFLRVIVGLISITLACLALFAKHSKFKSKTALFVTGFIAGAIQTCTGTPGPLIVLLLAARHTHEQPMRKTLVIYFLFLSFATIPLYAAAHIINMSGVLLGLSAVPVAVFAGYAGNRLIKFVPQKHYATIALITVAVSGILAIYLGILKK